MKPRNYTQINDILKKIGRFQQGHLLYFTVNGKYLP